MISHAIVRAIDARGNTVSEVQFIPGLLSETQDQIDTVASRLRRQGVGFVRLVVDIAVSPLPVSRTPVRPVVHV